ncbi:hypothetical protein M378DRAFT_867477 [Amanita muscaria Koide BX008]|uniref:Uncharacterized protein n=1 Tax=Amanita muscaria (strain Koide BX008) TaxID=946122 RepID=A0A0C2SDP5_AMAMK|nr:hypothetical protein M378DRAFT_867477 [Amanita muscaria Koide BX008]
MNHSLIHLRTKKGITLRSISEHKTHRISPFYGMRSAYGFYHSSLRLFGNQVRKDRSEQDVHGDQSRQALCNVYAVAANLSAPSPLFPPNTPNSTQGCIHAVLE